MGLLQSKVALDEITNEFNSSPEATMMLLTDKLKFSLYELQIKMLDTRQGNGYVFWIHLDRSIKRTISDSGVTCTMKGAFLVLDIETSKHAAECQDDGYERKNWNCQNGRC